MVMLITPALEGLRPQWREAARASARRGSPTCATSRSRCWRRRSIGAVLLLFGNAFAAYATALALVGDTVNIVPAQIHDAINGNVLVNETGIGLALGVEMIVVIVIVMIGYWLVQRRARRWLQ